MESKYKHTPGPWSVSGGDDVWIGERFCVHVGDEDDANLIAAAPCLIEALENLYESVDSGVELTPEILRAAQAAITRATGQSK